MLAERLPPHMHQAERADQNEGQVGHHVPEVRDAEQRPLIGEAMVNLALRDRRNQQKPCQRNRGKAEQKGERAGPNRGWNAHFRHIIRGFRRLACLIYRPAIDLHSPGPYVPPALARV